MKDKKKTSKSRKISKKSAKPAKTKEEYYDKFDEKEYSGPEVSVNIVLQRKKRLLKHLESDIVKQNENETEHIDDEEDQLSEDPRASEEGLGIEEEETAGQEPYPEIADAEKDPEEEEEE